MTLDQLRIFVAVAERQHVTRAAEALNLVQSAVSTAIANIEGRHATKLFHRVGRGIELTEAGRMFLVEARAVLARAEAAELVLADLSGLRRGTLALFASQTIASDWLPRHLVAFRRAYPEIAIRLAVGNTTDAADAVRAGQAELGFVEGALDDPTLASTTIAQDKLVLVVAPNHPFAGRLHSHPKTSPGPTGCCAKRDREPARPSRRPWVRPALPRPSSGSCSNCPRTRQCAPPSRPGAGPPSCPRPWSPQRFERDPGAGGVRLTEPAVPGAAPQGALPQPGRRRASRPDRDGEHQMSEPAKPVPPTTRG